MNRIVVDAGRHAVKTLWGGERLIFPAVIAPARKFRMEFNINDAEYHHIKLDGEEWFVGNLAIQQSDYGKQDRDRRKANKQNKILVINAISYFAENGDHISLLINVPARDWAIQKDEMIAYFRGGYVVEHKAGYRQGAVISFTIDEVKVMPEGVGAYFAFYLDDNLKVKRPEYQEGRTLVLEVGDQTINYITMEDEDYIDADCGSLDLGLHVALANLQEWLENQGLEMTQAEITQKLINKRALFAGRNEVLIQAQAQREFDSLANKIFDRLNGRLDFRRFRNILLAGGGGFFLYNQIHTILGEGINIDCDQDGQWLNAIGFERMHRLRQQRMAQDA